MTEPDRAAIELALTLGRVDRLLFVRGYRRLTMMERSLVHELVEELQPVSDAYLVEAVCLARCYDGED